MKLNTSWFLTWQQKDNFPFESCHCNALGLYHLWTPALLIFLHTKLCIRLLLISTDRWLNYSPSLLSKGLKGETFTLSFQWYSVISRRYPHTTAAVCFNSQTYSLTEIRFPTGHANFTASTLRLFWSSIMLTQSIGIVNKIIYHKKTCKCS